MRQGDSREIHSDSFRLEANVFKSSKKSKKRKMFRMNKNNLIRQMARGMTLEKGGTLIFLIHEIVFT